MTILRGPRNVGLSFNFGRIAVPQQTTFMAPVGTLAESGGHDLCLFCCNLRLPHRLPRCQSEHVKREPGTESAHIAARAV
jgi:hypothetical protein